jgi:plasmid stabilization system protein ParE
MKVVWTATAKKSLREIYDYILLDSPMAAQKVRDELISAANQLAEYPEKYQHDEYYVLSHGTFVGFSNGVTESLMKSRKITLSFWL